MGVIALDRDAAADSDLVALAENATNGIWVRTGAGTGSARSILGTANEITVTYGDGVSADPTISLPSAITLTGKTMLGGTFSTFTVSNTISGSPSLLGNWTFGAAPTLSSTAPTLKFQETDQAADNQRWSLSLANSVFVLRASSDDEATLVNPIRVLRTGTTIDEIELNATTLDFNGAMDVSGALTNAGVAVPTISSTSTLTNKTLSSPTISGTVAGTPTISSAWAFSTSPTVPTPTLSTQAANKAYVDSVAVGLSPKDSVACATTANITLSGEQTIDGVATSASRVLVKNQSTASQNGIYVSAAGAWARATDMDAWSETVGAIVPVTGGSANANTIFVSTAAAGGTIGSTSLSFAVFITTSGLQPLDSDLTAIAALTTASFGRSVLETADAAALRTLAGTVIGTDVSAAGALMTSSLGSGVETFLGTPSSANLRAALTDETGTGAAVFATDPAITITATGEASAISLADRAANVAYVVSTYSALQGLETRSGKSALCQGRASIGDGGGGVFRFLTGNQSALVTSDPQKFVYVPPTADTSGASGVWVRECNTADIWLDWGGATGDGSVDDAAIMKAAWLFLLKQGGGVCNMGAKIYRWATAQEFAFLVRSGSAGSATGYQGAGNGNNQATSAGVNISYKGGVTFRGQGTGTGDSVFNDDGATIIDFDVNLALRLISVYNVRFEDMALRNTADLSASGSKVIHITSYDSPVETTYGVYFTRCAFLDDSYESETVTTGINDAFVVVENAKLPVFDDCTIYKQGNAIRFGGEAASNPSTLLAGEASGPILRNCQIAGDIVYVNMRQFLADSCEWWPLDAQTTAGSGGGVAAIIKPSGTGFFDTATLLNCKASFDGNDTRTFFETVSGDDGGTINVIGGVYGDYEVLFEHNGDGNLNLLGPKFRQTSGSQTDIVLGSTFNGMLFDTSESVFTTNNSGTHLDDNRTGGVVDAKATSDLTASLGVPRVAYMNGVAVPSTNTTSEETLRTITIPGGSLGLYGSVEIDVCFSMTSGANNKTPRVRIGGASGTQVLAPTLTTSASIRAIVNVQNRNSQSSQISQSSATTVGQTSTSVITASVNTASDWDIVISTQKAVGTDSAQLEWVKVTILKRDIP